MAKVAMSEKSLQVFEYLKEIGNDKNVTAAEVAEALGFNDKRQVDGIFTSGIQRKGYGERIAAEIELEDGTHKTVKFLKLTIDGLNYDHEKAQEIDAENEAAKKEDAE